MNRKNHPQSNGEHQTVSDSKPGQLQAFLAAIQFLLFSPAFIKRPFTARELGASVAYYPLVGLILGSVLVEADMLLKLTVPDLVRAALVLGLWILLTGALHLDGFLDSLDGLLGGTDPHQRMMIMRDERIGAYAFTGGALLLLLKFSALASIKIQIPALLIAPVLGRLAMVLALTAFPYARAEGLGRQMKDQVGVREAIFALVFTGLVMIVLVLKGAIWPVLASILAATAVGGLVVWFANKQLNGLTGDIYGALNEVVELTVLIVCTIFPPGVS